MEDFLGNKLEINDEVVFIVKANGGSIILRKGKITHFKKVGAHMCAYTKEHRSGSSASKIIKYV